MSKTSRREYGSPSVIGDDPPVGTVVPGHEQVIYLGNGEWHSLDDTPNR